MQWNASFLSGTVQQLFGGGDRRSSRKASALQEIREAMLECLSGHSASNQRALHQRIMYAKDIQDLWYLRADVLTAIASSHGEAVARKRVERLGSMFRGHLPKGQVSRPSPLGE